MFHWALEGLLKALTGHRAGGFRQVNLTMTLTYLVRQGHRLFALRHETNHVVRFGGSEWTVLQEPSYCAFWLLLLRCALLSHTEFRYLS